MSEPIMPVRDDVAVTGERRVVCDGPTFSKHPRVYLTMVDDLLGQPEQVVCPYCGKVFMYDAEMAANIAAAH